MDWKTWLTGAAKSNTVRINVLITAALLFFAEKYNVPLTPDEAMVFTSLLYGIVNLIMRAITGKSLPERGLEVKLPKYTDTVVKKVIEVIEAKQPTKEEIAEEVINNLAQKSRVIKQIVESKQSQ